MSTRTTHRLAAAVAVTAIGIGLAATLLVPSGGRAEGPPEGERASELRGTVEALRTQLRTERADHRRALSRERRDDAPGVPADAIRLAAAAYDQSEERLRSVAECESSLQADAVNGPYLGLFQFGLPLWNRTPYRDLPRSHPYAAALAAGWAFSQGMSSHWPVCGRR